MNYSLTTIGGSMSATDQSRFQTIGAVCLLASASSHHGAMPLQQTVDRLRMPIQLGQIEVYFNDFEQCMGYVTWAYLHADVERRIIRTKSLALYDFEWNEGNSLWIIDLLIPHGALRAVMAHLRDVPFTDEPVVTYARMKEQGVIFKRLSRNRASNFWSVAKSSPSALNKSLR